MGAFKIFYSWQSDLAGNKTRFFIRECIDYAIELALDSEAIEAERDEATKGTTGSPNIVQSIFSKINECDLFIADITPCYSDNDVRGKKSPNPNVLIELGYAIKTLGEDRIICLCNTDYGTEYPFDIAQNRITNYSLDGRETRKEVKGDISHIIFLNIRDLRKHEPRLKKGNANHVIGSYDLEEKKVKKVLIPLDIRQQEAYIKNNEIILKKAKSLLNDIDDLTKKINSVTCSDNKRCSSNLDYRNNSLTDIEPAEAIDKAITNKLPEGELTIGEQVVISDSDTIREQIKVLLNVEVGEKFFDLGNLRRKKTIIPYRDYDYNGSMEEIDKYEKLLNLSFLLHFYELRQHYPNTFTNMLFIPIAIQNISHILDNDIRIVLHISGAELIRTSKKLIADEIEGSQGLLCENDEGISTVRDLFNLIEDGVIHREAIEPLELSSSIIPQFNAFGPISFEKDEDDYESELDEYITFPSGDDYYEFEIKQLRPNECKWLDTGILIKPIRQKISIKYRIHSAHSTGEIHGELSVC